MGRKRIEKDKHSVGASITLKAPVAIMRDWLLANKINISVICNAAIEAAYLDAKHKNLLKKDVNFEMEKQ